MNKRCKLIYIYLLVCEMYSTILAQEVQRLSNNCRPKFTDEEAITCYLFALLEQKQNVKSVHGFICEYWGEWFPNLPSYAQFTKQINFLAPAIEMFAKNLIYRNFKADNMEFLLDSMPIVIANAKRSRTARVAHELCDKGYCASKNMYFYGVKLHGLLQAQSHKLPKMHAFRVEPASRSDLTVGKELLQTAENLTVYADKAYIDATWREELSQQNVRLLTPIKLKKGEKALNAADALWSRAVSSVRQPIESFFAWLQDKTQIQRASKVRSESGLIAFIFARIAVAAILFFN